jgi:methanogenic corrinoid protein MtbC1
VFAEAATQADAVWLSALMTTTLPNMARAIGAIREARAIPVLVGGAVVTRDFAEGLSAGYSEDAPGCVAAVRDAIARNSESGE